MDEFYKLPLQKSDGISKDVSEPELFSNVGQYEEESYDEDKQSFPIVDDSCNMDEENDIIDLNKEESGFMGPLAPYPSAEEERSLWKRYLKLRRIGEILGSETITVKTSGAGRIFFKIVEDISESVDLIEMLRGLSGIDKLGDKIIEDSNNTTRAMVELYRLIQSSEGRSNTKAKSKSENSCCIRDLFGFIFIEMLNNIAFGTGNKNLVDKIVKATNGDTNDVRTRIYTLAINRELLPSSIMKLIDPKTPFIKLPQAARGIQPIQFSKVVLNDYKSFINNIQVDGKAARDRLIEAHLRLAMKRARVLANENDSMDVGDLFQEGSMGLIKAAEHFNPAWGTRFMSYAPWWVHQTIDRAIGDQARTIRIPVHMVETINKLLRISRRLAQEYGREPTPKEIGLEMDISPQKVREITEVAQLPISLESPIGAEEDNLGDLIEDRDALPLSDAASKQLLKEQIDDVLSTLTPREQRVIQLRFGLEDGRSRTLEEVGREFMLTRERIRQIEAKAFHKLRHPSRSRKLKDYL